MTVSNTLARKDYAGDGIITVFAVPFFFELNSEIEVSLRTDATGVETDWTENVEYTLAGAGEAGGGTLTVDVDPVDNTPATGETLVIRRILPLTQDTDFIANDELPEDTLERGLDRIVRILQQFEEKLARVLAFKKTSPTKDVELPEPEADKLLGWNAGATAIENKAAGSGGGVTDHGALTGLADDDHTQYHTDARALTWLGTRTADDLPEGATNRYTTVADESKLAGIQAGAEVNVVTAVHGRTGAVVGVAGDYDGLDLNLQDKLLTRPEIKDYALTVNAKGNQATTVACDFTLGNVTTATLTGNVTVTAANWPASGKRGRMEIHLTQDATGSRTVTVWPVDKWVGGVAPTLGTASGNVDIIVITSDDAGTTRIGAHVGTAS